MHMGMKALSPYHVQELYKNLRMKRGKRRDPVGGPDTVCTISWVENVGGCFSHERVCSYVQTIENYKLNNSISFHHSVKKHNYFLDIQLQNMLI